MEGERGVCTAEFARAVGVSYRVADYWARLGTLRPSIADAQGSGTARRYSRADVAVGRVLAHLAVHGARGPVLAEVAAVLAGLERPWSGFLTVSAAGAVSWSPGLDAVEESVVTAAWVVRLAGVEADTPTPTSAAA